MDKRRTQGSPFISEPSFLHRLVTPVFYQYRYRLLLGLLALLSVDFLQLTIPGYLKKGVDSLSLGQATSAGLLGTCACILATAACIAGLRFCWRTLIIGFSRHLEEKLRNKLFAHILTMDKPFFDSYSTGDIMAHATNDMAAIQMACGMGLVAGIDAAVMSLAALCFMWNINGTLTLIAILPMPLLAVSTWFLSAKLHRRFDLVQQQFSLLTEFTRNTMASIRLIKAYTREKRQCADFADLSKKYVDSNLRVAVIQGLLFPVSTLVGNIGMLLVLYYGGRLVIGKAISLGDFVAFVTFLYMLIWPMMAVGWVTNLVQRGVTSLRRIDRLLAEKPLLQKTEAVIMEPQPTTWSFSCHDLCFTYPGTSETVLQGISLCINNEIIGLAGKTGSGKTTFCRLLTRQYPVADAMLFFAGHDVNLLSPEIIRSHISYVSQNPVLFSGSVAENIALADPDASMEAIQEAAQLAAIHEEVLAMEDGYETRIGEQGLRLSGGQKQRVALARALLANREVMIIDDALSALDVAIEDRVIKGIRQWLHDKTVIIVSHRIKLLSCTDRVVIFDQGSIVDQGEHHELLKVNTFYQAMAVKQLGRLHA